jgi:hypothetical protein
VECGVAALEAADVGHLQVVVEVALDLPHDRDHHELAHREGGRQLVDRRELGRPVRGRVELRAELVGGEAVRGRLEARLRKRVGLAGGGVDGRLEEGRAEPPPHRDPGREHVREVDVLRAAQPAVVDVPEVVVGEGRRRRKTGGEDGQEDYETAAPWPRILPPQAPDSPKATRLFIPWGDGWVGAAAEKK